MNTKVLYAAAFALGLGIGLYGGENNFEYKHNKHVAVVDQFLTLQKCQDIGAPNDPKHPLASHIDHAFVCPDGAVIAITK